MGGVTKEKSGRRLLSGEVPLVDPGEGLLMAVADWVDKARKLPQTIGKVSKKYWGIRGYKKLGNRVDRDGKV